MLTSGGTTAHIDVGKVALVGVSFLYQVVVEELCLLLPLDDFEFDAGLLLYLLEHLLAVLGIAHGRSGTGAKCLYVIEFHELLEALHHVEHHLLTFLGNLSEGKTSLPSRSGMRMNMSFLMRSSSRDCFGIEALDEESGSVGADINGC